MGFQMRCDRCDRFIKNMSMIELKKCMDAGHEIVCKACQKWEQLSIKRVDAIVTKAHKDADVFKKNLRDLIQLEIQRSRKDVEGAEKKKEEKKKDGKDG